MNAGAVGRSFRRRIICAVMAFSALLTLFGQSAHAAGTGRTVRVGYYSMSNYQEYDSSSGEYRGYSYDYMMAVAQYAGWQYEFVPVDYDEGIRMLEDGELDLMNGVEITDSLSGRLSFPLSPRARAAPVSLFLPTTLRWPMRIFSPSPALRWGLTIQAAATAVLWITARTMTACPR